MEAINHRYISAFKYQIIVSILLLSSITGYSQLRLPKLISNGMVLQRETEVTIWGWANQEEKINVQFCDSTYQTKSNDKGEWKIKLAKLKAGGPHIMTIKADTTLTISDILIGDVWVCSGQSNMELPMRRVSPIYADEIANSTNNNIRYFAVPQTYNFKESQADLKTGAWKTANPENILSFSAVSYFFAKDLYVKYKMPVGLINASLGGSPAEAWISEDAIKTFPTHDEELQRFKNDSLITAIEANDRKTSDAWYKQLNQLDEGYKDPLQKWRDGNIQATDWKTMQIPGYWANTELGHTNGSVWFRKSINIPQSLIGKQAKLIMGRIVDADSIFINGTFVGTTSYQYPPRRYDIPTGVLKEGKNTISIRVISTGGQGGFVPDKQYEITAEGISIDLKGEWQYRLGAKMAPMAGQTFVRWKPTGLYNAMISPLLNYQIKGVIWYQGESNSDNPTEYQSLFTTLIHNWRDKWGQGDFPFLFVQLPNFMEAKDQPSQSNWALMREVQLNTLTEPNTGMAIAIDLGEWNDIHPLNKKDVGYRLSLAAQKVAYKDDQIMYSGPIYKAMQIKKSKIILSFDHIGSGLISKDGKELKRFEIAGADKKFVWAKATIKNNKIIVWHESIQNPVAVRYAWSDNPEEANLYNKEGLPASPFRTDKWTE